MKLDILNIEGLSPIYYRDGTSDAAIIQSNFCEKPEYIFPVGIGEIKHIFDIGGNIGILAVIMANHFPEAKIYSFEPVKENFDILLQNIAPYPNVVAFNYGLGSKNETKDIYMSDDSNNFGGFSLHKVGVNLENKTQIQIKDINDVIDEIGVEIDLVKIDTEGSEYDILTNITDSNLKPVNWILGELHGEKDFETLEHLRFKNFILGFNKPMDSRMFMFYARKV
jgi:FkbM family methyltransferase